MWRPLSVTTDESYDNYFVVVVLISYKINRNTD
jgi:hypothetical protein